ncbi:MAG: hypothetical protein MCS20_01450, partial [Candidatus Phytoplasma mali]|nr:hypothetical protein [Candidatus Phytoplasma australiense]MCG7202062.1 hypothetical protein [Candidatus Phytoplasma mali]
INLNLKNKKNTFKKINIEMTKFSFQYVLFLTSLIKYIYIYIYIYMFIFFTILKKIIYVVKNK